MMLLQGPNSSICNLPAIPFRVDDSNTAKNQICGEVSKEAKRGADVNEGGIANSTSVAGNDLLFVNNVLQARGTTLGTFTSLS